MRFQRDIARRVVICLLSCAAVLIASPWTSLAQQRGGASAPPSLLKGAEDHRYQNRSGLSTGQRHG
jgi:hypothetical protein